MSKFLNGLIGALLGIVSDLLIFISQLVPINDVNKAYMLGAAIVGLLLGVGLAIFEPLSIKSLLEKKRWFGVLIWLGVGVAGIYCLVSINVIARGNPSAYSMAFRTLGFNACLLYLASGVAINLEAVENVKKMFSTGNASTHDQTPPE